MLIITLTMIFNLINKWEHVPLNFKRGIQVPLFKGKRLCSADTNNYRGITLLSIFSKVYEMILWDRLEPWWKGNEEIYPNSRERVAKASPASTHPFYYKRPWRAPWNLMIGYSYPILMCLRRSTRSGLMASSLNCMTWGSEENYGDCCTGHIQVFSAGSV